MSQQKPPNPSRRRFFEDFLSNLGREAGRAVREARRAVREIDEAVSEAQGIDVGAPAVETPLPAEEDLSAVSARFDAIGAELAELEGQVQHLAQAVEQPQALAEEDRALLRQVMELLAERHTELAPEPATETKKEDEPVGETAVLRRRREALREKVWTLISALLGIRLFDALYETFVADELVPWAKEQWRGIFAQAEAAGVIEQSPLASPLPSPSAESPSPVETPTPKPETPTPPRRPPRQGRIPVPEMVTVGAGDFWMGSDKRIDRDARDDEMPQHRLYLPAYRIGKYPVTNEEYAAFVAATGQRVSGHWVEKQPPADKLDHPVVYVGWDDAMAYCRWLSEAIGQRFRLPSEAEWEKAARGSDGRIYPWGNQPPDTRRYNFNNNLSDTTPVGSYPAGVSSYGCYDMAGNVWEWTRSLYRDYPYRFDDGREAEGGTDSRVLRGGSFDFNRFSVRCAYRLRINRNGRYWDLGFRLLSPGS